ncbi:glycosyltransferase [Paenibacillus pasadenensis]|uniref:Lipopolysaccharide biosynthesis protein n=1 Tax=Paenibacillus pasadenensis TaxID=217090 RepID=A0A2N5NDC5_9BACL|nr:glycosyltransferase [Paenibacillus pasadenensis]PLT48318.1 Lipopolysaccharide biosynthesis protein [Paenibacillus pasadenensis]
MRLNILLKKSYATLKYEGVPSFSKKTTSYIKRNILGNKIKHNHFKDILFINGCTLPHPSRYRIDHQIEQLHFNNFSADQVYYENLKLEDVKFYRAFVFFRCPVTDLIEDFIKEAKYYNKKCFFDIDDLVIDEEYVSTIAHLKTMRQQDLKQYMDGVNRMKRTMLLCDYILTTTEGMARELRKFNPQTFINRNVASEKMVELSLKAISQKKPDPQKVILGYFSGSITHNADFNMIKDTIIDIMVDDPNVYLKVVGLLDIPEEFNAIRDRILVEKFMDWTKLPQLIASVDINLAPVEDTIFNQAKSENKWTEAALVKVPTVASKVGAFEEIIESGTTGILCSNQEEWKQSLLKLIRDDLMRKEIGGMAFKKAVNSHTTVQTGYSLVEYFQTQLNESILFVLPSTQISGGVNVVIKHCHILRNNGMDVTILSMGDSEENLVNKEGSINVICCHKTLIHATFSKAVATLWTTLSWINGYSKILQKYYLVQNYETNFYEYGNVMKIWANLTYNSPNTIYITISKWCKDWLENRFKQTVKYAANGIDLSLFKETERDFSGKEKIKILIEGNSSDYYKNVDESFRISNMLDKGKFEIWYLSYKGEPKEWYKYDRFFHQVPHERVNEIYSQCHILLKSSLLESFSYPPLEMMATGGFAVVAPNEGNIEYLIDGENSLLYRQGDIEHGLEMIEKICNDSELRKKIIDKSRITVKERSWGLLEKDIMDLYQIRQNV